MKAVRFSRAKARALLAAAALLCCASARAEGPEQKREFADYDAPNPKRTAVDYAQAAANVAFLNWSLWQLAWFSDKDWVPVTRDSLQDNLERGFTFDKDELPTNFFGHPYHGGLMFNGARGAGLSFWESFIYAGVGSFTWELFAEREPPSINDLVATTLGGTMLGEITHRLSSELLDDTTSGRERLLREAGAMVVSPMRGFNRLYSGDAWRDGMAPRYHPLRVELDLGVDQVRAVIQDGELDPPLPSPMIAVDVDYGDLLPMGEGNTLEPFEFFKLYAGLNLLNDELRGVYAYSSGLLYGWSSDLAADVAGTRDNNVFGFSANYEYVGNNLMTYSAVGIGPVDHVMSRFGGGRYLRASLGADFVPVLGASSTHVVDPERGYNFATGVAGWGALELRMGRFGELGLRTRHYATTVVDGEAGEEFVGSMRLWYELDLLRGVGVGAAPTLIYRRGVYRDSADYSAQQLSTQFYMKIYQ